MNFILRQFLKYDLRQPTVVYRLIDAALIGNFFDNHFLFLNRNFGQTSFIDDAMKQMDNNYNFANTKYVNRNVYISKYICNNSYLPRIIIHSILHMKLLFASKRMQNLLNKNNKITLIFQWLI